jgi:hypothetical protein
VSSAYWGSLALEASMFTQLAVGVVVASAAWLLAVSLLNHPARGELELIFLKLRATARQLMRQLIGLG